MIREIYYLFYYLLLIRSFTAWESIAFTQKKETVTGFYNTICKTSEVLLIIRVINL